jgi:hypothetical protein
MNKFEIMTVESKNIMDDDALAMIQGGIAYLDEDCSCGSANTNTSGGDCTCGSGNSNKASLYLSFE